MSERTLYCPENWHIRAPRVTLVGAGGTGSEVFDGLLRLHQALIALGHPEGLNVRVFDHDEVSPTNIARQRFLPGDEGLNKAELLVHRANVYSGTAWEAEPVAFDPWSVDHMDTDLLVSCVDSAQCRGQIAEAAKQARAGCPEAPHRLPSLWLDTGNDASTAQVVLGQMDQWPHSGMEDVRMPHVVDLYPDLLERTDDGNQPSCSTAEALAEQDLFINRVTADTAMETLWRLLRDGRVGHHACWIQLAPIRVTSMPIDPKQWQLFGYDPAVS